MADQRLEKLAQILVRYSTRVQPGDRVAVRGFPLTAVAEPLLLALMREILEAGGHPHFLIQSDSLRSLFLRHANEAQLTYVNPFLRMISEEFEVDIRLSSSTNTRELSTLDTAQLDHWRAGNKDLVDRWFHRSGSGELRWVATRYPTHAYAQDAEMSLTEFEDFFFASCYADSDDPIDRWVGLAAAQKQVAERLNHVRELHLLGPDIDLKLGVAERTFIASTGENNMPDGEIFTGPIEESAQGWVRFSYPCIYTSVEVDGVELVFDRGRVIEASATKNDAYLQATLETDPGARYLGELGIGTNETIQRFTRNMLFDEKMAGTIHLALGGGYTDTGSKNRSAIHWDMLVNMREGGEINADGETIYRNGEFTFG